MLLRYPFPIIYAFEPYLSLRKLLQRWEVPSDVPEDVRNKLKTRLLVCLCLCLFDSPAEYPKGHNETLDLDRSW